MIYLRFYDTDVKIIQSLHVIQTQFPIPGQDFSIANYSNSLRMSFQPLGLVGTASAFSSKDWQV